MAEVMPCYFRSLALYSPVCFLALAMFAPRTQPSPCGRRTPRVDTTCRRPGAQPERALVWTGHFGCPVQSSFQTTPVQMPSDVNGVRNSKRQPHNWAESTYGKNDERLKLWFWATRVDTNRWRHVANSSDTFKT